MKVQDSSSNNDNLDDPKTTENFVYTDDYQTEDAFSQISILNEFVEEETQEISTFSKRQDEKQVPPAVKAFPAIEKFQAFREGPKSRPDAAKGKKGKAQKSVRSPNSSFSMPKGFLESLTHAIKGHSRQGIVISVGTVLLSGLLIILGFISLRI